MDLNNVEIKRLILPAPDHLREICDGFVKIFMVIDFVLLLLQFDTKTSGNYEKIFLVIALC